MSSFSHDLRCGLLRWRYLAVIALFLLPCITFWMQLRLYDTPGTWGDYLLYCFKGSKIMDSNAFADHQLPAQWLLVIGGCLYLNLDYTLHDLTSAGQQVIVRIGSRRGWYLSKCLWNFLACLLYCGLACAAVLLFTALTQGSVSLANSPDISLVIYSIVIYEPVMLSAGEVVVLTVLLPFLTVAALSMLEMTLCLFVRPVISFLVCMFLLVLVLFLNEPWALGIGAMGIRSSLVVEGGVEPGAAAAAAAAVIIVCAVIGCWRFKRTDILGLEE